MGMIVGLVVVKSRTYFDKSHRRASRDSRGLWITHPTLALTYAQFSDDDHRLLRSAGFEERGFTYGAAAAFEDLQPKLRNYVIGVPRMPRVPQISPVRTQISVCYPIFSKGPFRDPTS
ncbi:hypothetical protein TESG_00559 [Trichophyton tonsurans CBS 112818]|uniref:Uncharacterized protein n=1 Tax=Trichophyton tonsurans (strain CBS 112818) TaxID=647933 RepID=F2RNU4_TRIT1|nr:hypothetical protein TESG_00559 [Trichophyton tonsurans CBS 112818]